MAKRVIVAPSGYGYKPGDTFVDIVVGIFPEAFLDAEPVRTIPLTGPGSEAGRELSARIG